ncbi:hypothetical protein CHH28_08820 [Bacterioplanes sanyensis]|uniref:Uncharacterized protein n=1 Tax=Bacterioplanes sanyensis TaxID=1249553 RepID=A0A222FIG6_9GAMM|nr:hypothetical protein [Bacterioplanes sanyensis]ASP38778.1 hypothetical protein CHH28_08820 [Bacterioplanes sanyensis]
MRKFLALAGCLTALSSVIAEPLTEKQMHEYHMVAPMMESVFTEFVEETPETKKALQKAAFDFNDHATKLKLLRQLEHGSGFLAVAEAPMRQATGFDNADEWAAVGDRISCLRMGIFAVSMSAGMSGELSSEDMDQFPYYFSDSSKPADKREKYTKMLTEFVEERGCTDVKDVSLYLNNVKRWDEMAQSDA